MRPEETGRWPANGQFWARLNPLSLYRMDLVGEEAGGDPGCFQMHLWSPQGEEEVTWVDQLGIEFFRYLWFDKVVEGLAFRLPANTPTPGKIKAQVGDVWLIQQGRWDGNSTVAIHEPRLVFIGPKTEDDEVHVLADWAVTLHNDLALATAVLYQPGPGRRLPEPKSVYEHLRTPSV